MKPMNRAARRALPKPKPILQYSTPIPDPDTSKWVAWTPGCIPTINRDIHAARYTRPVSSRIKLPCR